MEKMTNYEIQRRQWQERFLSMDQEALCRRLPGLELAESQLRLRHFGRLFAVSRRDGTIRCLTDGAPASYNEAMNIYTLLHYARPDARWTGRWLPFRDLRHASPFAAAFQRDEEKIFKHRCSFKFSIIEVEGETNTMTLQELLDRAEVPIRIEKRQRRKMDFDFF